MVEEISLNDRRNIKGYENCETYEEFIAERGKRHQVKSLAYADTNIKFLVQLKKGIGAEQNTEGINLV